MAEIADNLNDLQKKSIHCVTEASNDAEQLNDALAKLKNTNRKLQETA